ncbi:YaiO family outer membrane beta-barrel protein [Legionella lytica]|uniref:YaiO family outer membrane beta-barrel protein n=1 Tax=Legionella lytica TaxID=96232 RepID=A0ABY4YAY1_9GAMM|nr:tetratricopeptide repeat protein [Legionella lytica]USQ14786.1 YaiO family outer membrane beta-barrel protein [Legionella lytica]
MQRHIIILSCFMFFDAMASSPQAIQINQPHHLVNPSNKKLSAASPYSFQQVQRLRREGKLAQAKTLAKAYLQQHPTDGDMLFVLGLIYYQERNFNEASSCFSRVLAKTPTYMDARIALIRIKILNKKFQEASNLIVVGLYQNPKQQELIELKATIIQEVSILSAKGLLKKHPGEAARRAVAITKQPIAVTKHAVAIAKQPIAVTKHAVAIAKQPIGVTKHAVAITKRVAEVKKPPATSLAEIKTLRAQGKLNIAKEKSLQNLKINPKDLDSELLLGLIYLQLKDYPQARVRLRAVLIQKPDYLDARIGLIKLNLVQKRVKEAGDLIRQGMATNPHNYQPLLLLKKQLAYLTTPQKAKRAYSARQAPKVDKLAQAKSYIAQKKYNEAKIILQNLVAQYPNNSEYHIALANFYLDRHNDMKALSVIRRGLKSNPYNADLLIKQGMIHDTLRQYSLAARSYQQAKKSSPKDKKIGGLLADINSISPRYAYGLNEIGISSDNAYVSDLHSVWDWSSIYYSRDTIYGVATAKVNYASRLQQKAPQYELDFSPRFNRNIYADLSVAFASKPAIFPDVATSGEAYVNIPKFFELSGGAKYAKIAQTFFVTYTSSISFYPSSYWFNFRPYYFVPKGHKNTSLLYTVKARKYFGGTLDHYFGIGAGSGKSPDLADLLTVNFIVIQNNYINASYGFPIFNHHVITELGAGYQRWKYPSNLVRNLYDGSVAFKYRF